MIVVAPGQRLAGNRPMDSSRSADRSDMDRLLGVAPLPQISAPLPAPATVGPPQAPLLAEFGPAALLDFAEPADPVARKQAMAHLIGHIDAECFISLLQTMDPLPDDPRARAEYRRFYRQLREALEVPLLPLDAPSSGVTS
jgi:hypothetical protein